MFAEGPSREGGFRSRHPHPGQIGSRYPALLATLKNSAGLQTAFRQSPEDAAAMAHLVPDGEVRFVPRTLDSPAWDVRRASPEELRRRFVAGLSRLPDRTFWFEARRFGLPAVELTAPVVAFEAARRAAERAPEWIREACARDTEGETRQSLDEVLAWRLRRVAELAAGGASRPPGDEPEEPARPAPRRGSAPRQAARRQRDAGGAPPRPDEPDEPTPPAGPADDDFPFLG